MKKHLSTFLLAVGFIALYGCGEKKAVLSEKKEKITVAQGGEPKSLDPHAANETTSSRITAQIYSNLVRKDSNSNIVPVLVEKWEKIDDITTLFHLKKGVKFHNGEPLKASDIAFTFSRMKNSATVAHIIGPLKEVEVVDDHTFKIITTAPFAGLLDHLAHSAAVIVNEKAVKEGGSNYGQNPVGTGPFMFKTWEAGQKVTLKQNPEYFAGAPAVKELVFRNIPEGGNRSISLETGEVDIAFDLDTVDLERIESHEKLALKKAPSFTINYLGFNTNKKPFDNPAVREAVSLVIDMDSIISAVYKGEAARANSPIGPFVFGYNSDLPFHKVDIEKAKNLMAEAGYENGIKTKIWVDENTARRDTATIIQDQLKSIGIDAEIEILERGAFLSNTGKGAHEMMVSGWTHSTGYPDVGMTSLFHSKTPGVAGNRAFYSNSEVDRCLDEAKKTTDAETRKTLYKKAQELIQKDLPVLTLSYPMQNAGMQKNITGFELAANGAPQLSNIKFAD